MIAWQWFCVSPTKGAKLENCDSFASPSLYVITSMLPCWFMCIVEFGQKLPLWIPTLNDGLGHGQAKRHLRILATFRRLIYRLLPQRFRFSRIIEGGLQLLHKTQVESHDMNWILFPVPEEIRRFRRRLLIRWWYR